MIHQDINTSKRIDKQADAMRVAVVVRQFPIASQTFVVQYILGLIEKGCDVDIFCYDRECDNVQNDGNIKQVLDHARVYKAEYVARNETGLLRYVLQFLYAFCLNPLTFLKLLRPSSYGGREGWYASCLLKVSVFRKGHRQYDAICVHFLYNAHLVALAKELKFIDGPLLVHLHGIDVSPCRSKRDICLHARVEPLVQLYIANTEYTKNRAISIGCDPSRFALVPAPLDASKFSATKRPISIGPPYKIIAVGRFVEKKGHEYAIRAVKIVRDSGLEAVLTIVGDGELRPAMEQLVRELGLKESVFFAGMLPPHGVQTLLAASDLFVFPSVETKQGDAEGQGVAVQEAQAVGIPIVANRHNGIPDGVIEGKTALLVPEHDIDALADAIAHVLRNPELRNTMREHGRSFVVAKFDRSVVASRMLEIIASVN